MYFYKSALAIDKNLDAQWANVDISNLRMIDIFAVYRKVYVTLTNNFLNTDVAIDLDSLRAVYSSDEITFNNFLILNADNTLVTIPAIPNHTTKFAKWSDAFRAGYKVEVMNINTSLTANVLPSSKTAIRLDRNNPPTDMGIFFDHCLVSINGFFHRTDTDRQFTYVLDANDSLFKSKQNQVGILSFLDIGKIEQVSITPDMIIPQANGAPLKNKTFLKLGMDISNKTVMLVLGGYLLFIDDKSFMQNGDDTFVLNFNQMPLLERFFESNPYINLKALGLPESSDNISLVNVPEFFSDANLIKYLTLSQSFFVILDSPSIFTNKIYLRESKLPGMFTAYKEPVDPLFVNNGRIAEYWKTLEDGHWAVSVQDSYLRNSIFSSKPEDQLVNVSDSTIPLKTYYNSKGFLLQIGHDGL